MNWIIAIVTASFMQNIVKCFAKSNKENLALQQDKIIRNLLSVTKFQWLLSEEKIKIVLNKIGNVNMMYTVFSCVLLSHSFVTIAWLQILVYYFHRENLGDYISAKDWAYSEITQESKVNLLIYVEFSVINKSFLLFFCRKPIEVLLNLSQRTYNWNPSSENNTSYLSVVR